MNVKVTVQTFARPNLRLADNFHTGMEDFAVMLRKNGTTVPKRVED